MQRDISQRQALPLLAAIDFHAYLVRHQLTWEEVACASHVPVLTVWSMDHGLLVGNEQAALVCKGVKKLAGEVFHYFLPPLAIIKERANYNDGRGKDGISQEKCKRGC
ncbi:hypothetical protein KSF_077250 [Reticulibacter mediterranei]|uniref:Uncharacterized protein n=1 Tax=Reticulibacter mediterranei TaxID=2778369 RepID=A0A8J3IVS0_9CHLR|nr:hypothetical protein [Reticulibacter mediterranei]GHO97677.1 hypothetical protein KSF_077250 [Reticulibacter mediterranei]